MRAVLPHPGSERLLPAPRPSDDYRPAARAGFIILAVFFGGFGGWAAIAPLNAAVVAEGIVKIEGNRKSVQHLEGGTVRSIAVTEGAHVEAGAVLMELDKTQARAALDVLEQQRLQLLAVEARLQAEARGDRMVSFSAEFTGARDDKFSAILESQVREFEVRGRALAGKREVLEKRSLQFRTQMQGAQAQIASLSTRRDNLAGERASIEKLVKKGLATRSRLNELLRAESEVSGQLDAATNAGAVMAQSDAEVRAQMDELLADYYSQVAAELRDVTSRLADITPRVEAARVAFANTTIRAPSTGRVVDLRIFNVGSVVRPGENLLDIVPDDAPLHVEAKIRVEDVADVRPGMEAEVHFTSYNQKRLPLIGGTVHQISADRLKDERTLAPYYNVSVTVNPQDLAQSPNVTLYPGMPASVMIATEERTALQYLLGPLTASFDQSFRER